jgi:hypothetical protein
MIDGIRAAKPTDRILMLGISAKGIGECWGPVNQHAAAIASHGAASGQQIKQRLPQVGWKIGHRAAVSSCFKNGETDKALIFRDKMLSVSLFHGSGG